jgi:hypothetical protein
MLIKIRKNISILLVMLLMLGGCYGLIINGEKTYAVGTGDFAGGMGTVDDPFLVATPDQLNNLRYYLEEGTYFKQINDIDLDNYPENDPKGWMPIAPFQGNKYFFGNFDGNGYKIKNLMINRPDIAYYVGLFGMLKNGTIANVTLEDMDVTGSAATGGLVGLNFGTINTSTVSGSVYGHLHNTGGLVGDHYGAIAYSSSSATVYGKGHQVGGLVGSVEIYMSGTILNSFATGDVTGLGGYVGGLVGKSQGGGISNSYATGNVTGIGYWRIGGLVGDNAAPIHNSYATGDVEVNGEHEAGGLAGFNMSEISNSYAKGNVTGPKRVGGLVGQNGSHDQIGTINNSYATGTVTSSTDTDAGGLVGKHDGIGTISNSFYGESTLQSDTGKGVKKTTLEMQLQDTYMGWNFSGIWGIDSSLNDGYPYLVALPSATIVGVTAPVIGATPVSSIATDQFNATIAWSPALVDGSFAGAKAYTATITLTPKTGYTLAGVRADFFTVSGATATNSANAGVITAVFPATAPSSAATLTSTIGTVSIGGTANETITNIPNGTTLAALKAAITPATDATFEIYNVDGTTITTTLATGKKVIVTAQDGITKVTYTVTVRSSTSSSGGDSPSPANDAVTSTDGTLTLLSGRTGELSFLGEVTVSIPANATDKELKLTIEKVLNTQSLLTDQEVLASPIYEILKNFSENFSKPVTLTFTFDSASLKSNQRAAVFYYDEVKKVWVEVGGKVSGNKITVDVNHFTKFAVLAVNQVTDIPATDAPTDVSLSDISGHWAEAGIKLAVSDGIVSGYPDGTFRPNHTVTRAEFAVMLMNAWKPQDEGVELTFTDKTMIGVWAQKAIAQAVQAGIISGYVDGTFGPNAEVTRAEMAVMIAFALGQSSEANVIATGFSDDEDIPVWAKGSVAYLRQAGIMIGKGDQLFGPQDHVTRAEAVTVILNMLKHLSN